MGRIERTRELARRRTRKAKLKKLRKKFQQAETDSEKAAITAKAQRVSPFAVLE
jgi:hypothetical protein